LQVQQYKTVSESFEKRVLDLHLELMKKDEEMTHLKEQMSEMIIWITLSFVLLSLHPFTI